MESKFSGMSSEQVTAMTQRVTQIGRSVGINFKSGGKIGSTRDAHRLIRLSRTKSSDVQNALVDKLFEAYHELEKDISSQDVLREIAIDAGLEGPEVDECLNSSLGRDSVDDEALKNRKMVNSGVPTFIIQGMHRVDGAQDPQEFLEIFIKVKEGES
jgi:predicted DsbA family dithiol-disulfide isomerase